MTSKITVKAPSSTANLGPGFDVFGLALDAFYDEVTICKRKKKGIAITSSGGKEVPTSPTKNTAGLVISKMVKKFGISDGFDVVIKKGVPPGFGMGSSAASAAAAAVAFAKLYKLGLDGNSLVEYAGMGEKASAGSIHYDNVAASVLGGFVIVRTKPVNVIRIDPPKDLRLCVAIPQLEVPAKKTEVSRSVIPKKVSLSDSVKNLSNASAMVAGFLKKDSVMVGSSINDAIIEPARQHMIPGYAQVKKQALRAGALGVTISGAGPSVISFTTKSLDNEKICKAMKRGFSGSKIKCQTIICRPSKGATVIKK